MNGHRLISAADQKAWLAALQSCGDSDIYHLPQYHLLAERMGEGAPFLFFFQQDGRSAALPFILRPVANVDGLEDSPSFDITSVYGYPGVVTSMDENDVGATEFRAAFQLQLSELFQDLSVVAFFTRTNPLLNNSWLFKGLAEILPLSNTVAIDLAGSEERQLEGMTKGHKYDIRKARNLGVVVEEDPSFEKIDEFIAIYNETMKRNGARDSYFFPREYYLELKDNFRDSIKLFFARLNGVAVSASMFFLSGRIIQYHLSGTPAEHFPLNGGKLILDEIRKYGAQNGYSWLHLGGGVGSSEDNLYRFKAGFSKKRLTFEIVRLIVDEEKYGELCNKRQDRLGTPMQNLARSGYFPGYRAQ